MAARFFPFFSDSCLTRFHRYLPLPVPCILAITTNTPSHIIKKQQHHTVTNNPFPTPTTQDSTTTMTTPLRPITNTADAGHTPAVAHRELSDAINNLKTNAAPGPNGTTKKTVQQAYNDDPDPLLTEEDFRDAIRRHKSIKRAINEEPALAKFMKVGSLKEDYRIAEKYFPPKEPIHPNEKTLQQKCAEADEEYNKAVRRGLVYSDIVNTPPPPTPPCRPTTSPTSPPYSSGPLADSPSNQTPTTEPISLFSDYT
jgi:hypothetical protein